MNDAWIAERMRTIQASGIRKIFGMAASLKDPVNLSIGQPHFDVPEVAKEAAIQAIRAGHNRYTVTQGIPELRAKIQAAVHQRHGHADRDVLITTGASGALMLALCCTVNPGDEVILFDPYFVAYPHLVTLAGGTAVHVDTYPDFQLDVDRVKAAITPRTKAILANSPMNPTGVVVARDRQRDLARLAQERGILLISDEIYRGFCYDEPFASLADFHEEVLVVDGFGKSYGMTGWRLGYAHGPRALIDEMAKLQQFTFVCAPNPVQRGAVAAWDSDLSGVIADYRRKRDRIVAGLRSQFEFVAPGGAFYCFPKSPWGTGTEFVTECLRHNLMLIPGETFSRHDTHFRLSFAAEDVTIDRGLEILSRLARQGEAGRRN